MTSAEASVRGSRPTFVTWYPYCRRSDGLAAALGGTSHLIHYLSFKRGTLPVPDQDFDACVLSQVIEHLGSAEQHRVLDNIRAKVLPGGSLIITTPNRPVSTRLRFGNGAFEPIENWMDPDELTQFLGEHGWAIRSTRFAFSFFPVLASRHTAFRALRYVTYDVLRLRNAVENATAARPVGDFVAVRAVPQ